MTPRRALFLGKAVTCRWCGAETTEPLAHREQCPLAMEVVETPCKCKAHLGERPMSRYVESSRPLRLAETALLQGLALNAVHARCCGGEGWN